jgi:hypothetical protein
MKLDLPGNEKLHGSNFRYYPPSAGADPSFGKYPPPCCHGRKQSITTLTNVT